MPTGGVVKVIADQQTGALLGATACGPTAAEVLGMLTLAVHKRIVLDDLRSTIYAFPTFYGGVREAIGAYVHGVTPVLAPEYAGFRPVEG